MFQINDYVFYGSGGICRIQDIQTAPLENMPADRQYYVMQSIHDRNGVLYVPVDSDQVFLRRLLSRAEAEELIGRIPTIDAIEESNAKQLRARYADAMHTHQPVEWIRVIKTVHLRIATRTARTQRISETERTLADTAKRYLHAELALALDLPEAGMEAYLCSRLEKMA